MTTPFLALRTGTPVGSPYALTVHDLGPVHVPSGRLEASDPYVSLGDGLVVPVPPGSYPVIVTVADVSPEQDGSHLREAYLSVVLDDAARTADTAIPFVPADVPEADAEDSVFGVPVDAGTVGFADAAAASAAAAAVDNLHDDVFDHDGPDAWFARQDSADHLVEGCANVPLPGAASENVVLAHSGWGDGFYAVVTTHDDAGKLTGVHIDLGLLDEDDEDEWLRAATVGDNGSVAAAEIEIDVALVRALLTEQYPDLAALPLEVVAQGWDNVMARLGDDLAVRLPRREVAAELVEHEQRWLAVLAPTLPATVPVPVRVGVPSAAMGYPWSWSVVPWVPGTRASDVPVGRRTALAAPLAQFLLALHRPAPTGFPINPVRGVPLAARDAAVRARLASGVVPDEARARAVWDRAVAAPVWEGPPLWIHGDLHPGNLVVADDDTLAAVVDFGDLTAGDPATDLAATWLVLDAPARAVFREHLTVRYRADDPVWLRAQGWAVSMASSMLTSGPEHAWLLDLGEQALEQVLADA